MPSHTGQPCAQVPWLQRIGWLILIWLASVCALGVAAYALRLVMNAIGMTS